MKKINLFFLRPNSFACVITTKGGIQDRYDRKVTVDLEGAKQWESGTMVSSKRVTTMQDSMLKTFNDEKYCFISTKDWYDKNNDDLLYMPLPKKMAESRDEHYTEDLRYTINMSTFNVFLATKNMSKETLEFDLLVEMATGISWPEHIVQVSVYNKQVFINGQPAKVMYNGIQLRFTPIEKYFTEPIFSTHCTRFDRTVDSNPKIAEIYKKLEPYIK